MFVAMLDEQQRRVLIRAAAALAERDGARPDAEAELLAALSIEAGLPEIPSPPDSDDGCSRRSLRHSERDQAARHTLLLQLAGVTLIDGSPDPVVGVGPTR